MASGGVRGAAETVRVLRALARGVPEQQLRDIRHQALEPMQDSARDHFRANGSYVSGVIPADIVIADTKPGQTSLGMTGQGAKLGHLIEFGTAPHEQPNRGTYHPGAEPKPFMRPAFDDERDNVLRRAGQQIAEQLRRIALATRR